MEYKIDKGVPYPKKRKPTSRFPFQDMEVGDSFFLTKDDANTVRAVASIFARRHGITLTVRNTTEQGVEGKRVWRTA